MLAAGVVAIVVILLAVVGVVESAPSAMRTVRGVRGDFFALGGPCSQGRCLLGGMATEEWRGVRGVVACRCCWSDVVVVVKGRSAADAEVSAGLSMQALCIERYDRMS